MLHTNLEERKKKYKMNILNKKDLSNMTNGTKVTGYAYVKSYQKYPTKNGGEYIGGFVEVIGSLPFKAWGNSVAFASLETEDYMNTICYINAEVNLYQGNLSLIINSLSAIEENGLSATDFFESKYNAESFWEDLQKSLNKHTSEECQEIFNTIVSGDVKERFMVEFAASFNHDNCKSGLIAHTVKVVKMCSLIKMYPSIVNRVSMDLLFLGAALHDIGKVAEYTDGVVNHVGQSLPHNTLGVLMLHDYKNLIVEKKGEQFFNQLVSILSQHHGEYGERPRTVASYVVHLIDCLEAQLTTINSMLESVDSSTQIRYDDYKLI